MRRRTRAAGEGRGRRVGSLFTSQAREAERGVGGQRNNPRYGGVRAGLSQTGARGARLMWVRIRAGAGRWGRLAGTWRPRAQRAEWVAARGARWEPARRSSGRALGRRSGQVVGVHTPGTDQPNQHPAWHPRQVSQVWLTASRPRRPLSSFPASAWPTTRPCA